MDALNENSRKLRDYRGPDRKTSQVTNYGHDITEHDKMRERCLAELHAFAATFHRKTEPAKVRETIARKVMNFFAKKKEEPAKTYPKVHEISGNMLTHLKVIANPSQPPRVRGVAAMELLYVYADMIERCEELQQIAAESHEEYGRLEDQIELFKRTYLEMTSWPERTPGHLLMPAAELSTYGQMMPTGVLMTGSFGPELLRAYDMHRTREKKVKDFQDRVVLLHSYLKSGDDPYRWFSWTSAAGEGDKLTGLWTGAVLVGTLRKVCTPENVALGLLASRTSLEYLAATGQIEKTIRPAEGLEAPQGLLYALTELREEAGTGRWRDWNSQGARHLAQVAKGGVNLRSIALRLPVEFILDERTCKTSPSVVNDVADYVVGHTNDENEIILRTLLTEGWGGSFAELLDAARNL